MCGWVISTLSQCPEHPALGYVKVTRHLPREYREPNTVESDLFAMGSTLYELVTDNVPYNELITVDPLEPLLSKDPSVGQGGSYVN